MAFTVREFHDLVEILENEPAWRAEIRRVILTDDLLTLPQVVRDLAVSMQEMSEIQRQHEARFERVEANIATIKTDVSQLKASVSQLETSVDKLDNRLGKLEVNVAKLNGRDLERLLRERPFVYLCRFALRLKAVGDAELAMLLEDAVERERLTEEEAEDAKLLDVVARGRRRSDAVPIYLVVEASVVIDHYDLAHAMRRAAIVEKASGMPPLPVIAGENILDDVRQPAEQSSAGWVLLA